MKPKLKKLNYFDTEFKMIETTIRSCWPNKSINRSINFSKSGSC